MDEHRFDAITRSFGRATTRRGMLRGLAAVAGGGTLSLSRAANVGARRCRPIGRNCRSHADCCTDYCNNDANRYQCTCPPGLGDCDGDGACEADVTTLTNCGACGNDCTADQPANTIASCTQGQCAYACRAGFADCNTDLGDGGGNGCETNLNSFNTCGSCTNDCATREGAFTCSDGQCFCRRVVAGDCKPCSIFTCACGRYEDVISVAC